MDINILGDRFIGMFKETSETGLVLRLEVNFKSHNGLKWTVFCKEDKDKDNLILVMPKNERNDIYHVLGMEGTITFEDLIEHSKKIIDFNMEIEEKRLLLRGKMTELTDLFTKHTIEDLRTLRFVVKEIQTVRFDEKPKEVKKKKTKKPLVLDNTEAHDVSGLPSSDSE